jgi:hypothetical protein
MNATERLFTLEEACERLKMGPIQIKLWLILWQELRGETFALTGIPGQALHSIELACTFEESDEESDPNAALRRVLAGEIPAARTPKRPDPPKPQSRTFRDDVLWLQSVLQQPELNPEDVRAAAHLLENQSNEIHGKNQEIAKLRLELSRTRYELKKLKSRILPWWQAWPRGKPKP